MRTLLIDADIVAYKCAANSQETFDFGDTGRVTVVERDACWKRIDETIDSLCSKLDAHAVRICLSDPNANWKQQLDPIYKANRAGAVKPELLMLAKDYLAHQHQAFIRPRLEADDIMGILSTSSKFVKGEKVIVSEDKDMRTVPGLLYNPNHSELGIIEVSELDADRFHMWQTMCGDPADGYPGCPGIGPESVYAKEIVFADREELWDIVLEAYASKGRTEDDAIHQARLAHILRCTDYNHQTKRIKLWQPYWLR